MQLGLGSLENEKWEKGRSEIKNEIDTVYICYNWVCVVVSAWEEHECWAEYVCVACILNEARVIKKGFDTEREWERAGERERERKRERGRDREHA